MIFKAEGTACMKAQRKGRAKLWEMVRRLIQLTLGIRTKTIKGNTLLSWPPFQFVGCAAPSLQAHPPLPGHQRLQSSRLDLEPAFLPVCVLFLGNLIHAWFQSHLYENLTCFCISSSESDLWLRLPVLHMPLGILKGIKFG